MARVCQVTDDLKDYLCMEPVDMRKQFQGLQGIVNEEFGRYLTDRKSTRLNSSPATSRMPSSA